MCYYFRYISHIFTATHQSFSWHNMGVPCILSENCALLYCNVLLAVVMEYSLFCGGVSLNSEFFTKYE